MKSTPKSKPSPSTSSASNRGRAGGKVRSSSTSEIRISDSTVKRLSKYLRTLATLERRGTRTVTSKMIAHLEGITSAQVRKDLSLLGSFGRRGLGYDVSDLKQSMVEKLGLHHTWNVAMVGAGNLGTALIDFHALRKDPFHIRLLFDNDPAIIGAQVKGMTVTDVGKLAPEVNRHNIGIVILAVPPEAAQSVINTLEGTTVRAVLNFSPKTLTAPPGIILRNEDTSIELESIAYYLTNSKSGSAEG